MLSFCPPCFQWKIFAAWKTYWGFVGFVAPHQTRYLTKTIRFVSSAIFFPGAPTTVLQDYSMVLGIDRNTGAKAIISLTTAVGQGGAFPDPCPTDFSNIQTILENSPLWTINSDTQAVYSQTGGGITTQYFVTLSDEYTLTDLEGDVDTLLAVVDPSTVPPMNLLQVTAPGDNMFGALDMGLAAIPNSYLYSTLGQAGLSHQPILKAAALTAYLPVESTQLIPGLAVGLLKLASMMAMAGNYCQKTFTLDYNVQPVGTPQCVSGVGTCNGWFTVPAPPLEPGRNAYKLVVPNCRCG